MVEKGKRRQWRCLCYGGQRERGPDLVSGVEIPLKSRICVVRGGRENS